MKKIRVYLIALSIVILISGCIQEQKGIYKTYKGKGENWSAEFVIFDQEDTDSPYTDGILKINYIGANDDNYSLTKSLNWSYIILHKNSVIKNNQIQFEGIKDEPVVISISGEGGIRVPNESFLDKKVVSNELNLNYDLLKKSKDEMYMEIEWGSITEKFIMKFNVNEPKEN